MGAISESRPVSGFDRIELRGYGDIYLTQGEEEGLTISADEQLMPRLISNVRGSTLVLDQDRNWLEWITLPHSPIRYDIQVRTLHGVSISGSGSLSADQLLGDEFEVGVSGSAKISMADLQMIDTRITLSGSSEIRLAGKSTRQQIRISGSATVRAIEFAGEDVDVRVSGSGEASVNAENNLSINISGSGSVNYRGNPRLSQKVSGSARIEQAR